MQILELINSIINSFGNISNDTKENFRRNFLYLSKIEKFTNELVYSSKDYDTTEICNLIISLNQCTFLSTEEKKAFLCFITKMEFVPYKIENKTHQPVDNIKDI